MSGATNIIDGTGYKYKARVSKVGQLTVGAYAYDQSVFKELAEPDTAYNFYKPKVGMQFVITAIIARADKQVSNTVEATVIVYEATAADTTTVSKVLYQDALVNDAVIRALPINILVNERLFINAKTDDDDIHMNILGYYIPKLT